MTGTDDLRRKLRAGENTEPEFELIGEEFVTRLHSPFA